ncbi:FadR/GntR family transcriptional regulator [Parahaliea mediterranea]|uniref:FadR family transcriptional regulator n=1 Tax=Parahaliea mediterranea TaxID=651086 RepID=A0A939III0_9GAMM|nr:FadR/GntR family transcriptional regulator [Parahaliea mediterranea]MBN7795271.1 FadR family transcriptional regulator [Parahaliea mediterranea]
MNNTSSKKRSSRGHVTATVDILGSRIISGIYKEGEALPIEQVLADSLDVGRNALREAVKVLSGKGLLVTAQRSGTRVRPRDEWNMLDPDVLGWHAKPEFASEKFMLELIELRCLIEPRAAELAASRATREDVSQILSAYEEMASYGSHQQERLDADIAFHSAVLKASHNSIISHFKHAISTYLKAHVDLGKEVSGAADQEDLEQHRKIAWAIATGKPEEAYSVSVEMLDLNRSHFGGKT